MGASSDTSEHLRIFTAGTFDLFHHGHVNLLKFCKNLGDVVVCLNTDEFIYRFKGQYPIMTYSERKSVLQSCRYVDCIIPNIAGEYINDAIVEAWPVDMIVVGSDWLEKDYLGQLKIDKEYLESNEIALVYAPYTEHISSTDIKKRLSDD